jgi:hypothetical protein
MTASCLRHCLMLFFFLREVALLLLNGNLHFETEPGRGTRFHLDLPVNNGWTLE